MDEALGVQAFMDKQFAAVSVFNSDHHGGDVVPIKSLISIEFDVKLQFIWKSKVFLNCQKILNYVMPCQSDSPPNPESAHDSYAGIWL